MRRIAGCILGFAIVGALACSDPQVTDPCEDTLCMHLQLDGAALFSEVCSGCHSLERPISASISRTDEVWALIHEMEENGVVVSDAEAAAIVEYVCKLKRCVTG